MSLYALPTLTEKKIADYIRANYVGSYHVSEAFTVQPYGLPFIMIKAGRFREIEPGMHVYEGSLAVAVMTQIDDEIEPLAVHDDTVANIYSLLAEQEPLFAAVNGGERFHIHGLYIDSYDQSIEERSLMSIIELNIKCQTQPMPPPVPAPAPAPEPPPA